MLKDRRTPKIPASQKLGLEVWPPMLFHSLPDEPHKERLLSQRDSAQAVTARRVTSLPRLPAEPDPAFSPRLRLQGCQKVLH